MRLLGTGLGLPLRHRRLWAGVALWQAGVALTLTSPYATLIYTSLPGINLAGESAVRSDYAVWTWLLLWREDAAALAPILAVLLAGLALLGWQFVAGGVFGSTAGTPASADGFAVNGARLFGVNLRITVLSWLPLAVVAVALSFAMLRIQIWIADNPRDDLTFRAVVIGGAAGLVLLLLLRFWADVAKACVAAGRTRGAYRSLMRAARLVLRRPLAVLLAVLVLHVGIAGLALGASHASSTAAGGVALVLQLVGLAYGRLALMGAAAAVAQEAR